MRTLKIGCVVACITFALLAVQLGAGHVHVSVLTSSGARLLSGTLARSGVATAGSTGLLSRAGHARAALELSEVHDKSSDACAAALGLPKVALLFLVKSAELPHTEAWRRWLQAAGGQVPAAAVRDTTCGVLQASAPDRLSAAVQRAAVKHACLPKSSSRQQSMSALDGQHLFSAYIHAPPPVADSELPQLWQGRMVSDRVATSWGNHSLVQATRQLLHEAYADPQNSRFVLVSESDIPLWDPLTFWSELTGLGRSRINACRQPSQRSHVNRRWTPRMRTRALSKQHWRKSSQWWALTREHAALVLHDSQIYRSFEKHCHYTQQDPDTGKERDCFSDEHYFATLLSVHGRDNETVCDGWGSSMVDWAGGGEHPRTFRAEEVTPALLLALRQAGGGCDPAAAQAQAARQFIDLSSGLQPGSCSGALAGLQAPSGVVMPGRCFMTARKFGNDTAAAVQGLLSDCENRLLHPAGCQAAELLSA